MTVTVHFNDKRKPKNFLTARSVIHKPTGYLIVWADFSKMTENGPELKHESFTPKEVKWITIH